MRIALWMFPLLLAAVVVAQQGETAEELITKLGHEDYEVREEATKKLIEMGDQAVPALEKALKSDDIEVRLRAGRALRGIRNGRAKEVQRERERLQPQDPRRPGARSSASAVEIQMGNGEVTVTVREKVDGKEQSKTYKGKSIEELKKKHPELRKHLGGVRFGVFGPGQLGFGRDRDPFDMDKFWEDWDRQWRDDVERWQKWMRRFDDERRRALQELVRPRATATAEILGIRARRPSAVLDAQLQLRGLGLVVEAVEKKSRADVLGLQRFDILLNLNGQDVRDARDVVRILAKHQKDSVLTAKIVRAGKTKELGGR